MKKATTKKTKKPAASQPDLSTPFDDVAVTKPAAKATRQPKETPVPKATKATRPARAPKTAEPATEPKAGSKTAIITALIGRKNGATLAEIMEATGWQKHSVRGFISILAKKGVKIESSKSDAGARTYRVV